jgi:hypothetical protein
MSRLDEVVSRALTDRFRHESRRSFLSRITRGLFGVAGFTVGATAAPYFMPMGAREAHSATPQNAGVADWMTCGLNGNLCFGPCAPKKFVEGTDPQGTDGLPTDKKSNYYTNGPDMTNAGQSWVLCCDKSGGYGPKKFSCCRYLDYCGIQGTNWTGLTQGARRLKCGGKPFDPSGAAWCGASYYQTAPLRRFREWKRGYICTDVVCDPAEYADYNGCMGNCKPPMPPVKTPTDSRTCHRNYNRLTLPPP